MTSSAVDKIFVPIFEQNVTINFKSIFEQNTDFGPIFEKGYISNILSMADEVNIRILFNQHLTMWMPKHRLNQLNIFQFIPKGGRGRATNHRLYQLSFL